MTGKRWSWEQIRRDYEDGMPNRMLKEKHGITSNYMLYQAISPTKASLLRRTRADLSQSIVSSEQACYNSGEDAYRAMAEWLLKIKEHVEPKYIERWLARHDTKGGKIRRIYEGCLQQNGKSK